MSDWLASGRNKIIAKIQAENPSAKPCVWPFKLSDSDGGWIVDAGDGLPARKVRPGWQARSTGTFISRRLDENLFWESRSEHAALLLCEYGLMPKSIRTQPFVVIHKLGSTITKSYPDIEITTADDRKVIIQVKADHALNRMDVSVRLERERIAFEACGWGYDIWPTSQVMKEPRYETLKTIHYFRSTAVDEKFRARIIDILSTNGPLALGHLIDELGDDLPMEATVIPLVTTGVLKIDIERAIDAETVISLSS